MLHHTDQTPNPTSSLAFDPGPAPDVYDPPDNPAGYYLGNTTESEVDDGSLGGTATTNVSFDEADAQSGMITPNGDIYNNSNNVGARAVVEVLGFAVT